MPVKGYKGTLKTSAGTSPSAPALRHSWPFWSKKNHPTGTRRDHLQSVYHLVFLEDGPEALRTVPTLPNRVLSFSPRGRR